MARSTSTSGSTEEITTEDLKEQIGKLREDVASLTDIVGKLGGQSARHARDTLRERGAAAAERGQEELEEIERAVRKAQGDLDHMIAQRPMMSVGLALGLGFLFGMMNGRK